MEVRAFELSELIEGRSQSGDSWLEFLRVPSLSMGLYVLPAGGNDPQTPHDEDEVYHVVSGRAVLQVAGRDQPVQAGSTVFVAQKVEHHFHSIDEELTALVFFAPAETDVAPD
jgi:mannose-6-phosphate isomerase-like protein (cupin superfamily)